TSDGSKLSTGGTNALTVTGTGLNTISAPLTLQTAQPIVIQSGNVSLSNTVDNGGNLVTLDGGGNLSISGKLMGAGGLNKIGSGTLTMSGNNTYSGLTTINNGTLNVQNSLALGASTAGTQINNPGVLQLQGGIAIQSEPLSLNSSAGLKGTLESISGLN